MVLKMYGREDVWSCSADFFGQASKLGSWSVEQTLTCPVLRAAAFTNTTSGSEFVSRNGRWLSDPVVVLRANSSSALLQLANPVYDAAAKTVTFQVGVLLLACNGLRICC